MSNMQELPEAEQPYKYGNDAHSVEQIGNTEGESWRPLNRVNSDQSDQEPQKRRD